MPLTTTEEVRQYLNEKEIQTNSITPLVDGTSNYIWRIADSKGQTMIFKHAEPHLSASPSTPFPLERMDFEARALELLPRLIPCDEWIRYPKIIHNDKECHVLILEDVGQRTLKEIYEDPGLDMPLIGARIGRWLARLHRGTTAPEVRGGFNHATAKRMYRWNYNSLASTMERFGYDAALGERINAKYGSLIETDDVCVCHTDMWPGNVLFDMSGEDPRMAIIDWEVARQGDGVTDIGHFAGEAWLLDRFRGARGLLGAFLRGYNEERELSREDRERVAAQFGTHVTHWPTIYDWIDEERTREAVEYGYQVLREVDSGNWKWFKKGDLGPLFEPGA